MANSFDQYAADYDAALDQGISMSGEDRDYFALGRIHRVRQWLVDAGASAETVLDFGCGTGTSAPLLVEVLGASRVLGVDPSPKSIDIARSTYADPRCSFCEPSEYRPVAGVEVAFCNGVFHHIPVAERAAALDYLHAALAPGGLFAFWENNPLNPGTRYVMRRIPFDRDAIMIRSGEARRMLRAHGFTVLRTEFLFFFPRPFRALRVVEPYLTRVPLGAQYGILCRKH